MKLIFEDIYAGMLGLFGGCFAYIKFPLLQIDWGKIMTGSLHLLWTCAIAFLTAAAGVLGKKAIEYYLEKRKQKKSNP